MHRSHRNLPAIVGFLTCVFFYFFLAGAGLALADEEKNVDLFPAQNMSSLLAPEEKPAPDIAKIAPPPAPPPSFTVRGEWNEEGREPHRVVVLEGFNQIYLLCAACSNDSAIHPGAQLPGGYLFKQLNPQSVDLIGPDGQEQSLFI